MNRSKRGHASGSNSTSLGLRGFLGSDLPAMLTPEKFEEASPAIFQEVGRLCSAWSFLEKRTENMLWGILDADERLGPIITWRLDLRGRWQLILKHAHKKHGADQIKELRNMNKDIVVVTRDRNIIVHGLIHSWAPTDSEQAPVCWTVFRGAEAGKNFPISLEAVAMVVTSIQKLGRKLIAFNETHKYERTWPRLDKIEVEWPKPLE
jgi:hypothetical protein